MAKTAVPTGSEKKGFLLGNSGNICGYGKQQNSQAEESSFRRRIQLRVSFPSERGFDLQGLLLLQKMLKRSSGSALGKKKKNIYIYIYIYR